MFQTNGYNPNTGWNQPPRPQATPNQWAHQTQPGLNHWQPQNMWQPRPPNWSPQGGQNQWSVNYPNEYRPFRAQQPQAEPLPQATGNQWAAQPPRGNQWSEPPRGQRPEWAAQDQYPFRAQQKPPMNPYPSGGNVMLSAMNMMR